MPCPVAWPIASSSCSPLAQEAAEVGKSVAGELHSTAQVGLDAVKDTAVEAVEEVQGEAQSSVGRVKGETSDAAQAVTARTKGATATVKKKAQGPTGAVKGEAKKAASSTKKAGVVSRSPRPANRQEVAAAPGRRP